MLTFAYKVAGWVWQNAYVILRFPRFPENDQIDPDNWVLVLIFRQNGGIRINEINEL